MIDSLFQTSNPVYISIRDYNFIINDKSLPLVKGIIHNLMPLRKFFFAGRLMCYSYNNKTGKDGRYCAFCHNRFRCQKRLRLMILVVNAEKEPLPAILEINQFSFDNLDQLIEQVGPKALPDTLLHITLVDDDHDRKVIEFQYDI